MKEKERLASKWPPFFFYTHPKQNSLHLLLGRIRNEGIKSQNCYAIEVHFQGRKHVFP